MKTHETDMLPVTTADGASSTITVFSKDSNDTSPVVVCMPAMGVAASFYEPLAASLVDAGLNAVTADLRGIGRHSVRASRATQFGYYEMVYFDWPAVVAAVKKRFPSSRLMLLGHSLGGQLSCLYAAAYPGTIDGLIVIASCSVHYAGWHFPRNMGVLFGTQLLSAFVGFFGYFPGHRVGFGGTESGKLIKDWAREARTGRYTVTDSPDDLEGLLRTVQVPVLAISLEGDFFAPQSAVRKLLAKLERSRITQLHFRGEDLGLDQLDHFKWVKNSRPMVKQIVDWMNYSVS